MTTYKPGLITDGIEMGANGAVFASADLQEVMEKYQTSNSKIMRTSNAFWIKMTESAYAASDKILGAAICTSVASLMTGVGEGYLGYQYGKNAKVLKDLEDPLTKEKFADEIKQKDKQLYSHEKAQGSHNGEIEGGLATAPKAVGDGTFDAHLVPANGAASADGIPSQQEGAGSATEAAPANGTPPVRENERLAKEAATIRDEREQIQRRYDDAKKVLEQEMAHNFQQSAALKAFSECGGNFLKGVEDSERTRVEAIKQICTDAKSSDDAAMQSGWRTANELSNIDTVRHQVILSGRG